ncbi:MAG TPA: hypothetical protein VL737_03620 [Candidatus Pristimantibacillus sp.]|nr:hypothetical protein [Candidatus Pristimantibacillus sp.]
MSHATLAFNALGIAGSILLLFGFYRVNSGRWTNKTLWYEFDNVIGAALIILYQIHYHAYVSVVVNTVWAGVAVLGLSVFFKRLHHHRRRRRA